MPTIVGILTFIIMINITSERFKAEGTSLLVFISSGNFVLRKKFYNLGAWATENIPATMIDTLLNSVWSNLLNIF